MKSKEVRKVVLRTDKMRRVRDNLRIILKLAIKDKLGSLDRNGDLYRHKEKKDRLTPSQQKRYDYVEGEYWTLYHRYNHSTLQCGSGAACYSLDKAIEEGLDPRDRPTDFDLVWVPWLRRWFCLKCFLFNRIGEMTSGDFDDSEMSKWVKEKFGI